MDTEKHNDAAFQLVHELMQSYIDRYRPRTAAEMPDETLTPVDIANEVEKYATCNPKQVVAFMKEAGWKLVLQHDNRFAYELMRRTVK